MLEQPRLLVQGWAPLEGEAAGELRRAILDADTRELIGFACWEKAGQSWWQRLGPVTLEVHERVDESLLMLMRRRWAFGAIWEVRDADSWPVALLRRGWVEDRQEAMLALMEQVGPLLRFRGFAGEDLGTVEPAEGGSQVTFASGLGENPFLRMAILATALRW
jgi:hypothetical protein